MANNTGLDEADVEPGDLRTPSLPKRNRSLVTPPVKFRILKIHAAETRPGKRPPRWEAPDFPRQRPAHCPLTLGNVGGSPTPGNHTAETALAGWGTRIRTWEWRNRFVRRRDRAGRSHGHRPRQGAALFMGRAGEQHWVPAIRVFAARRLHTASGQDESIRACR